MASWGRWMGWWMLALAAGSPPLLAQTRVQPASDTAVPVTFEEGPAVRLVAPPEGGSKVVASRPVTLQVGHLYRVSATLTGEGLRTDAEARYPTPLGACVTMASFPFTNASPSVAADQSRRVSVLFFATTAQDRVELHLGRNGKAWGAARFENVTLEKVEDIHAYLPKETIRWNGKAFRYEDGGWTFVHIEGDPYTRGRQYGELMAEDITRFMEKLATSKYPKDPAHFWSQWRTMADALFLRKYDPEFLEEMKGIADGAAKAGATFKGRALDLLDLVTLNSAIDLDYVRDGLDVAPHALTGRTFTKAEDQAAVAPDRDKCSSFVATGSATPNGRPVITQMFMWGTYTGVEWNVIVDVQPTRGQRLVFQTFPGGIHSGADWYLNQAGLVIGETTVGQTPFNPEGTPQSNRIRKAAQYATSIDEFATLMKTGNNGLYTNEWTLADMKTNEGGDLLLGTNQSKLWRTGSKGHAADTPGNLKDFIWANNNNRDLTVRKEYAGNTDEAPVDLAFNTWNRDIAFWRFYQRYGQGKIDLHAGIAAMASSPINRPHACDGKITTGEMADRMMFLAHYGKTTLREKMPGSRYVATDLPNFQPQLTLGYVAFSPIFVASKLQEARRSESEPAVKPAKLDLGDAKDAYTVAKDQLWKGTVYPASSFDFWYSSGTAAYHALLRRLPEAPDKAFASLRDGLSDWTARYLTFAEREGTQAPARTTVQYDRYGAYQLPRVKGGFLLHQLRLLLGNDAFFKAMKQVHGQFLLKPMTRDAWLQTVQQATGRDIRSFAAQWLDRTDLPQPTFDAKALPTAEGFDLNLTVTQPGEPWHFLTTVEVHTAKGIRLERLEAKVQTTRLTIPLKDKPTKVVFNAGQDIPVAQPEFGTLANLSDDWDHLLFVWGSARETEAGRTLALQFREQVADATTEVLPPLKADAAVTQQDLETKDLVILGGLDNNGLLQRLVAERRLPVELGKNWFRWQGKIYGRTDEGLILTVRNPYNPARNLYLVLANSRLQLWQMTKSFPRGIPGWAVWRGGEVTARGYHRNPAFESRLD